MRLLRSRPWKGDHHSRRSAPCTRTLSGFLNACFIGDTTLEHEIRFPVDENGCYVQAWVSSSWCECLRRFILWSMFHKTFNLRHRSNNFSTRDRIQEELLPNHLISIRPVTNFQFKQYNGKYKLQHKKQHDNNRHLQMRHFNKCHTGQSRK